MIRRLITAAILLLLILFLILDTGILLARVAQAEGLIVFKDETVDSYKYPKEARWMRYDLSKKNNKLEDEKVYISLGETPPNEDPGEGFSIVDKDDNLYPQMPTEKEGKVIHTLYKADYGWEWRSLKDVSLRAKIMASLQPFLKHPVGVKASTFDTDKERFILASVINYVLSMVVVMIPGYIIYRLVKRGI